MKQHHLAKSILKLTTVSLILDGLNISKYSKRVVMIYTGPTEELAEMEGDKEIAGCHLALIS